MRFFFNSGNLNSLADSFIVKLHVTDTLLSKNLFLYIVTFAKMLYNGLIKVSISTVIVLFNFDRIYILEKRCIKDMMKFSKRDSKKND
ncbi:hypothetical protein BPULL_1957 [Bifidobacterium pullorum]|uniref:Uncharacterized protein n=1 Tax=Bifidobacterium pullorum TaxID=78448 RepID=A0A7V8KRV9_9BIFI|nr:hypothetical protein BPULL_1957 [Bifidobacterium pullorum]